MLFHTKFRQKPPKFRQNSVENYKILVNFSTEEGTRKKEIKFLKRKKEEGSEKRPGRRKKKVEGRNSAQLW